MRSGLLNACGGVSLVALLAGCSVFDRPYADAPSVASIQEKESDTPGVITVSEPQLYARENLINDRREELKYLKDMLEKSEGLNFDTPSISRNLSDAVAARFAANIGYDPETGRQNRVIQRQNEQRESLADADMEYRAQLYKDLQAAELERDNLEAENSRINAELSAQNKTIEEIDIQIESKQAIIDSYKESDDEARKAEVEVATQEKVLLLQQKAAPNVAVARLKAEQAAVGARITALNTRVGNIEKALGTETNAPKSIEQKEYTSISGPGSSANAQAALTSLNRRIENAFNSFQDVTTVEEGGKKTTTRTPRKIATPSSTSAEVAPIDSFRDRQALPR